MRWKDKYYEGETKVVKRFLFFPKRLSVYGAGGDGRVETRWLESTKILQQYTRIYGWSDWRWALEE